MTGRRRFQFDDNGIGIAIGLLVLAGVFAFFAWVVGGGVASWVLGVLSGLLCVIGVLGVAVEVGDAHTRASDGSWRPEEGHDVR